MKKQRFALGLLAGVLVVTALLFTALQVFQPAAAAELPNQPLVDKAKNELSGQIGVPSKEIKVISIEEVEWSDSSLGCPKPDELYLQVITPGYKIVLEAGGKTYEFHTTTNADGHMTQCSGQVQPKSVQP